MNLGSLTGDELDLVVGLQLLEDVLLFVKDRVVRLQVVLGQEFRLDDGREVEQGVAHSQDEMLGHFVRAAFIYSLDTCRKVSKPAATSLTKHPPQQIETVADCTSDFYRND